MTIHLTLNLRAALLAAALCAVLVVLGVTFTGSRAEGEPAGAPRVALGSGFTYQGRLTEGDIPASGSRTFRFTLHSEAAANAPIGASIVQTLTVTGGLFTTVLDFGAGAFNGEARWLDVEVQTTPGTFVLLPPRQALTAVPYALHVLHVPEHDHFSETWMGQAERGLGLQNSASDGTGLSVQTSGLRSTAIQATNTGTCTAANSYCYGLRSVATTSTAGNGFGGVGVRGDGSNTGLWGTGNQFGVLGTSTAGAGVSGVSSSAAGVSGSSTSGNGVHGVSAELPGVQGEGQWGVYGLSERSSGYGVYGFATMANSYGIYGYVTAANSYAVYGNATNNTSYGVYGKGTGWAGFFEGNARATGVVVAASFATSSDSRLKSNIAGLSSGLEEILALRPVTFSWTADDGSNVHRGLIAQEVAAVIPDAVREPDASEEYYALDYDALVATLIKAVQEQQTQIDTLEAELDELRP